MCKCVLPPGDNPIAANKYIISYHIVSENQLVRYGIYTAVQEIVHNSAEESSVLGCYILLLDKKISTFQWIVVP